MSEKIESLVRTEIPDNQANNQKHEKLEAFKHNIGHLDMLLRAYNSEQHTKRTSLLETLNAVLSSRWFGGKNGWFDQKAYFAPEGESVVLVINTIADGVPNSSIWDMNKLLSDIDRILQDDKEKKFGSGNPENKLNHYHDVLMKAMRESQKIRGEYEKSADDFSMSFDYIKEHLGFDSNKQDAEKALSTLQNDIRKEYEDFLKAFKSTKFDNEEQERKYRAQKRSFENLLGIKIENPEYMTKKVLTDVRTITIPANLYLWVAVGFCEAIKELFLFFYNMVVFSVDEKYRETVISQIIEVAKLLVNFDSELIIGAFKSEIQKIEELPDEEQAYAYGKIAGNVIGAIETGSALKSVMRSSTLRVAFKWAEEVTAAKTAGTVTEWAIGLSGKTISRAKNWKELYEAIDRIDHIRFKEGMTSEKIRELIDGVRNGRSIREIPDVAGLRQRVEDLIKYGWEVPEATGFARAIEVASDAMDSSVQKSFAKIEKHAPGFAKDLLSTKSRIDTVAKAWYDIFDFRVTAMRTVIESSIAQTKTTIGGYISRLTSPLTGTIRSGLTEIRSLQFPGKAKILTGIEKAIALKEWTKQFVSNTKHKIEQLLPERNPNNKLSSGQLKKLKFSGGLAVEVVKDREGNILFNQYRDHRGKVAFQGRFEEAGNFVDGQATVKTEKWLGIINKKGEWIIEPKYDVLHTLSETVKIGKQDGKHTIMKWIPGTREWVEQNKEFHFMTEPRSRMAIAAEKLPDGREFKYIINESGEAIKVNYRFVDDFENDIAAAESYDGKWHIIDKTGTKIGNIKADTNLEALDQFRSLNDSMRYLWNKDTIRSYMTGGAVRRASNENVSTALFDHIQESDAKFGFRRVKKDGKWGLIDKEGNLLTEIKYDSMNIQDDSLHHLEVRIGNDVGLISRKGQEIIPVSYTDILSPRSGVYGGVIYDSNYSVVHQGRFVDYSSELGASIDINNAFPNTLGKVVNTLSYANLARTLRNKVMRTFDEETSVFIREMEWVSLQKLLTGFDKVGENLSPRFEKLAHEMNGVLNESELQALIEKAVDEELESHSKQFKFSRFARKDEMRVFEAKKWEIRQALVEKIRNQMRWIDTNPYLYPEKALLEKLTANLDPQIYANMETSRIKRRIMRYSI